MVINNNWNGTQKHFNQKLQIKNNKSNNCTNNIVKECSNLKKFKLQDLIEEYLLQIIFHQLKGIFHHNLMNHLNKIILVLNLMIEMTMNNKYIMKILLKKIFLVKFFLIEKMMTARLRLMHLVVSKWVKALCCRVKISLTSDKQIYLPMIFSYFVFFNIFIINLAFTCKLNGLIIYFYLFYFLIF